MTSWPTLNLGDLAAPEKGAITDGPFGSHLTSAHYTDEGPLVVRLQNIGDGVFKHAPSHISEDHFRSLAKHQVAPGDLLVASLGESLPRACLAPADLGPAIVKADCIRVRLGDAVDSRWVMYALQQPSLRQWAKDHLHGVGRPRLGLKLIRELPVPVPPIDEQRRIVDILEDHLSRLDAAQSYVAGAAQRTSLLRIRLADQLLALDGTDTTIGAASDVISGPAFRSKDFGVQGDGIRLLRGDNIAPGAVRWERVRTLPERLVPGNEHLHLAVDDLILAMDRPLISTGLKLARVTGDDVPSLLVQRVARIRTNPDVLPGYLYVLLHSHLFRSHLELGQVGTQLPHITLARIRSFRFPLPELTEQVQRLTALTQRLEVCDELDRTLSVSARRTQSLRRALLAAAFSGRLTGHASDLDLAEESASV